MKCFQSFHQLKLCCLILCLSVSMSYGVECIINHKTGVTENCPSMFGNRDRIFCCEQMDGTVFCCDYDEYIRNRGKRRRIENVRKVISDREIDYPWRLLDWIVYIVPVMQVCLCIICCICSPCCKQRRRGFVYRIQQPSAIVNVQPYDPPPGIPPHQATMSILPQSSASVPITMPQATSSPLPLVHMHSSPYARHSTLPPDHATPFDDPPPPYSAVVSDMYSKQIP